jgi:Domain of unknown function (DUF4326)
MPVRVQLQRRAGWRMPSNTVKVDRSTRWGNPMRAGPGYPPAQAVADFDLWINGSPGPQFQPISAPPSHEDIRRHLGDRNLACWCPLGQPCHADVLLELANAPGQP